MSRAKIDVLEMLHRTIAQELLNRIRSGEASAQDFNAAIKFLKDNNISFEPEEGANDPMVLLGKAMKDMDLPEFPS